MSSSLESIRKQRIRHSTNPEHASSILRVVHEGLAACERDRTQDERALTKRIHQGTASFLGRWRKYIAKLSLQDLAVTILRQGMHEVVPFGPLEPRDAIKTMSVELSIGDG
jgi:hypothetical protein